MQNITCIDTARGNRLYHINTGSICGYPAPYRRVELSDEGADVKTVNLESFDWDFKGLTAEEHMKEHFQFMLRDIFDSMENDIEHFKLLARGFSMDEKTVDALKPVLYLLGKFINSLTFSTLGKLFFVSSKIDEKVKDVKVKDFMLEVITGMFSGYRSYTPDTPEYRSFMPVVKKLSKVIRPKDYFGNTVTLEELMEDLLYINGEFDYTNAFLPSMKK